MAYRSPFACIVLFFASVLALVSVGFADPNFPDPSRVVQISWRPRIFLYKGFLSDEECDHMVELARSEIKRSSVENEVSGKTIYSEVRTSSGMFLRKHHDEVITRIERRIASWTFLPEENGEPLQVQRYLEGEKIEPHFDAFSDKRYLEYGGNRIASLLMYLTSVEKGGETIFPYAEGAASQYKDETWSECSRNGFAVKPRKGDALLFFNLHLNGTIDEATVHGSCPVIEGEKWSAPKWIRVRSFVRLQNSSSSK